MLPVSTVAAPKARLFLHVLPLARLCRVSRRRIWPLENSASLPFESTLFELRYRSPARESMPGKSGITIVLAAMSLSTTRSDSQRLHGVRSDALLAVGRVKKLHRLGAEQQVLGRRLRRGARHPPSSATTTTRSATASSWSASCTTTHSRCVLPLPRGPTIGAARGRPPSIAADLIRPTSRSITCAPDRPLDEIRGWHRGRREGRDQRAPSARPGSPSPTRFKRGGRARRRSCDGRPRGRGIVVVLQSFRGHRGPARRRAGPAAG